MRLMRKEGSRTVHRALWDKRTWCSQSGWRMVWHYTDEDPKKIPATMRLCKKCFGEQARQKRK